MQIIILIKFFIGPAHDFSWFQFFQHSAHETCETVVGCIASVHGNAWEGIFTDFLFLFFIYLFFFCDSVNTLSFTIK